MNRADRTAEEQAKMSSQQHDVVHRTQMNNPERVKKSQTLEALIADERLCIEREIRGD